MDSLLIILVILAAALGFLAGYNKGGNKTTSETVTQAVCQTTSVALTNTINSVFAHYQDIIVKGTAEEAVTAFNILDTKIGHLKMIEGKIKVLDGVLKNVEVYE